MDTEWITELLEGPLAIDPLSWRAIAACVLSGGLIGFERHRQGKPIGMRTNILICLGTYTFVAAALTVVTDASDPTRVIGQVIAGIGFLGAGVILTRDGIVVGVTTAASIWMLAGIGVVIATQTPFLGVKLSVLCVIVLTCVGYIERGVEIAGGKMKKSIEPDAGHGSERPSDELPDGAFDVEPLDIADSSGSQHAELKKHEHE